MSRQLSQREKIILFVCILTGLVYVLFLSAIKPLREQALFLDSSIEGKELRIQKEQRVLAKAEDIEQKYELFVESYHQAGSNDQVMSKILSEIKEVAGSLELNIPDLKPKRVRRQDYFNRFSVSLTLNSEFNEVMKFLYILQKAPHLFSVDEISFDVGSRRRKAGMKTRLVLSRIYVFEKE